MGFRVTRIFLPFAIGYFLSYLYRTINAVLGPVLMEDLSLTPSEIGFLTGVFFFAFAISQIPLGLAIDRFGPRRTEGFMLFVGAAGAIIFSVAETIIGLSLGRALIGLGVAGCLVCAFKAFALWFPTERLPFVNGCILSVGGLGAIVASSPFQRSLVEFGWPVVFVVLSIITLLAAIIILSVVPERKTMNTGTALKRQLRELGAIVNSRTFWLVAPLIMTAQAAWFSHQALWLGPWLGDVAQKTPRAAADSLLIGATGMVIGFITFGFIADHLRNKGVRTNTVAAIGTGAFIIVQMLITFPIGIAAEILCFGFGFFGSAISLFYADLTQRFPLGLTGRVTTTAALLAFLGGFALNVATGLILEHWPNPMGYQIAFGGAVCLQLSSFAWFSINALKQKDQLH